MSTEILMPALSPTMTEGNLSKWLIKKGDTIKAGDLIAEIETDKATMEIEAVDEGVVLDLLFKEGEANIPVNKAIAIIGDPKERYKEDPVRMLRAIRFSAKLGFSIEENTRKPIDELSYLLDSVSSARLFDETLKLMIGGNAVKTFAMLQDYQLGTYLFSPTLEALAETDNSSAKLVELALQNTDQRFAEDKSITPSFLFAALLWPVLKLHLAESKNLGLAPQQAFEKSAQFAINEQLGYTAIPRRFTLVTKDIWELQS